MIDDWRGRSGCGRTGDRLCSFCIPIVLVGGGTTGSALLTAGLPGIDLKLVRVVEPHLVREASGSGEIVRLRDLGWRTEG